MRAAFMWTLRELRHWTRAGAVVFTAAHMAGMWPHYVKGKPGLMLFSAGKDGG
ncbi:hypothetical protein [Mycobacterium leprae]|uniref:hypothetical protein n=1 Tax=Mycobacterium leprae TaxID=1769 RepID=UPI0002FBD160|nr:hypothetical protein [Mycobacterium leprae]